METSESKKETKGTKKHPNATLRVTKATGKLFHRILEDANRKEFGKRIKADPVIACALSKITEADIRELQNASLSNADRLERDYRAYVAEHGALSKDAYLGKRLSGEIPASDPGSLSTAAQNH